MSMIVVNRSGCISVGLFSRMICATSFTMTIMLVKAASSSSTKTPLFLTCVHLFRGVKGLLRGHQGSPCPTPACQLSQPTAHLEASQRLT
jgi:hypothetical protein